jgi:uncharacterized protein (TIGR02300 family)
VFRAELGEKRRCLSCHAAFFDLNHKQIVCPKCNAVFQVVELPRSAPRKTQFRSDTSEPISTGHAVSSADVLSRDADGGEADDRVAAKGGSDAVEDLI